MVIAVEQRSTSDSEINDVRNYRIVQGYGIDMDWLMGNAMDPGVISMKILSHREMTQEEHLCFPEMYWVEPEWLS